MMLRVKPGEVKDGYDLQIARNAMSAGRDATGDQLVADFLIPPGMKLAAPTTAYLPLFTLSP
jgi:hypothetical protein